MTGKPDAYAEGEKPQPAPSRGLSLHPAFYIACWIFFSNLTILFNKWLLDSAGFKYPVILTCWHLVFATVATQVLARTTTLLDSRKDVKMTGRIYLRAIVPIGLVYSASLVCSNLTYLYLSVAFIQMLKAAAPVAVLFVGWVMGVQDPPMRTVLNICFIVVGVGLASFGEIEFSWIGFLFQVGGIVFEALRLTLIEILLSGDGQKMDPLVSLYYYAPVCAVMNFTIALMTEWPSFDYADLVGTGFFMLLMNALLAFLLNISSVFLIGKTSGLVMTLTGILKNILLIIVSIMIWHNAISSFQYLGYGIALAGLVYYSVGWDGIVTSSVALWLLAKNLVTSSNPDDSLLTVAVRRALFLGLLLTLVVIWIVSSMRHGSEQPPVQIPS